MANSAFPEPQKPVAGDATILIILMGDIAWLGVYMGVYVKINNPITSSSKDNIHLFG